MISEEEKYIHFVSSIKNLNNARRILSEIKEQPDNSLLISAFKFAIIEYSKPYKISHGAHKKTRHQLDDGYVPAEYSELHQRIVKTRDQLLAHSDISILDAMVHTITIKDKTYVGYSTNIIDETEELGNIDEIIDLIEKTLENMYIDLDNFKEEISLANKSKK